MKDWSPREYYRRLTVGEARKLPGCVGLVLVCSECRPKFMSWDELKMADDRPISDLRAGLGCGGDCRPMIEPALVK
jgi:hypothetical protein